MGSHLVVLGCLLVQGDGVVLNVGLLQQRVVELKLRKAGAGNKYTGVSLATPPPPVYVSGIERHKQWHGDTGRL